MKTFPDVTSLAKASSEDVNKIWAGLGYYRRAQMLLKGAQWVANENNSTIPNDVESLLKIPGIGPYTAGAIASIAFGSVAPIVDGNVIRVISRLVATKFMTGSKDMNKLCWTVAKDLVDEDDPGSFNQALMELGATICKPTSPKCDSCPIQEICVSKKIVDKAKLIWSKSGIEPVSKKRKAIEAVEDPQEIDGLPLDLAYFPRRPAKKKVPEMMFHVKVFYYVVDKSSDIRYLFVKRENTGLLANQWEFPSLLIELDDASDEEDKIAEVTVKLEENGTFKEFMCKEYGIQWDFASDSAINVKVPMEGAISRTFISEICNSEVSSLKDPIVHIFSHQKHFMHVQFHKVIASDFFEEVIDNISLNESQSSTDSVRESKWMTATEIINQGATSGCRKVLTAAEKQILSPKKVKSKVSPLLKYFKIDSSKN
jgi:adenine-specific DNA glycosylase